MANLVTVEANALLGGSSGQAAYPAVTTPIKVALVTATGTATTAGTEVAGGSYARQTITFAAPSGGSISSNLRPELHQHARLHGHRGRRVGLGGYADPTLVRQPVSIQDGQRW